MTHMNNQSRLLSACIGFAAAVLLTCSQAGAQSFTGSISGTITDASGAVVLGAKVTAIRLDTNRRVSAATGIDGVYLATALPVGEYRVEVAAPGFKQAVHTGLKLELNQAAVIDFRLEVGKSTELVQVTSDAPLLESTTSDLGKVVDNRRILDLATEHRNVFTLINLTPRRARLLVFPLRLPGVGGLRLAYQYERDRRGRRHSGDAAAARALRHLGFSLRRPVDPGE
jgi:hypothetical protein